MRLTPGEAEHQLVEVCAGGAPVERPRPPSSFTLCSLDHRHGAAPPTADYHPYGRLLRPADQTIRPGPRRP